MHKPLAEILRPKNLDQSIGQRHLVGEGGILRRAIEGGKIHSMILWGPPGVGKTTLALLMAELADADFYMLSAINSGVKEIRETIDKAKKGERTSILFIDEIHRFSKSQQDSLLGAVEQGIITLIGATTENPSFEVISPLLSRCQVYVLKNLTEDELKQIITTAVAHLEAERSVKIVVQESDALLRISGGDARKLINAIELSVNYAPEVSGVLTLTNESVKQCIQKNLAIYDKQGENHYDIISAYIKSVRGSDPNAAVYWLARMLSAGEDPLFIARRLIILASEDIGIANPNALLLANSCFQAVHQIGMPEARIILSETTVYLASSPKSNSTYLAINEAMDWVSKTGDLPVPLHIRNAPTQLMKKLNYGKDYKYAHNYENHFVEQEFLPDAIRGKKFYEPQNNARENELRKYLKNCWKEKYQYIIIFVIALFSLFTQKLQAQDIHFSQFYNAPLHLNPAEAGAIQGVFRASLHQRTQWLSVTKPYATVSGSFDLPIYKNKKYKFLFGLGALVNNDRSGDSEFNAFDAGLSLSFLKSFGWRSQFRIGVGVSGSYTQKSLNYAKLHFDEQFQNGYFNPEIPVTEIFGNDKIGYFDLGLGGTFCYSPANKTEITIGIGIFHLTHPNQTFRDGIFLHPIKYAPYITSRIALTNELTLSPMVYTAFQGNFKEITFGSNIEYDINKNRYTTWVTLGGGIFYRWNDAIILNMLLDWKHLRFCFSYDINISTLMSASHARGGFELSLRYIFRKSSIRKIGKEPCPYEIM